MLTPAHIANAIVVQPTGVVALDLGAALLGLTRKAIEGKIARGTWLEGREYHRAPDGMIWVNLDGVRRWVVGGAAASKSARTASAFSTPSPAQDGNDAR